jgi:hypothetical protein
MALFCTKIASEPIFHAESHYATEIGFFAHDVAKSTRDQII